MYVNQSFQLGLRLLKRHSGSEEQDKDTSTLKTFSLLLRLTSRFILPIISLIFTLGFLTIGLVKSYSSGDVQDPNMFDCLTIDLD